MSKKDAYIEKAQATLEELTAKINLLKAQLKGQAADQKIQHHEQIEKLEKTMEDAKTHLAEITRSSGDAWQKLTSRFDELTHNIGDSVKKLLKK